MTHPTETAPLILRESAREQIRLYVSAYRGKTRLHLRTFWWDSKEETWKPSREGISLSQAELAALLPVLQGVQQEGVLS
ncbi:transcriptional coactivator p15/PC4 family protein [Candidatus Cyanaurora vandensis]|uniref:transcriptional coactivator p15/PC4 family protein n=1 Tax=Candidatus Cyanaurora vandensis TaxID=2714958 RepID=UPI00257C9C6E|nr:transcriptional coactivator p15/PC4 family protein [Candidatus Cyanaurora vandensis]